MKLTGLFLLLVSFAGLVNMPECDAQKSKTRGEQGERATPTPTPGKQRPGVMNNEIKQLVAGQHCSISESFVFVARDVETYRALESLNLTLPAQDADFFKTHAVIAAFLGERNTGGFSVEITAGKDGAIQITEQKARGMVTQVLTTPFKIVAVPVKTDEPIALLLDPTWAERWRTYRVTGGELTVTGGFAGIHETSDLTGSLRVMRAVGSQQSATGALSASNKQSLITLMFELQSNGKRSRQLLDVVSGTITDSGQLHLTSLDSHALSGAIQSPFKATGQFTNNELEVGLDLETVESPHISDNFTARASLRATAISPRPANRAVGGDQ